RALTLAEEDLRAIVVHEDEHRRCRDVGLLAAALLLVAAQPWNPVLWWATGRLRLALETDCDRRTLRRLRSMTPARYGRLLLAEAAQGGPGLVPSIGLGRPARSLEARIRILTAGATLRAGLGGACLALVAVLAACEVPQPAAPLPTETARPEAAEDVWMRGPFEVRMPERPNELAAEAWSGEGRGELAVRVRFGPDGHPSRWAVDAFSDGLTVAMAEAATDVLEELRLTVGADGEPTERGWVPLWLLFDRGSVMLTLVSPDMYERDGIDEPGGEERLRRLMDTYRRLRGVGGGFLDIPASVGLRSGGRELLPTDRSSVGGDPTFGTGLDGGASVSARSVGTSTR
ncbi:MAG TPA: M56 family metallopeptidase, partial [Longimicrobiales bacterium]|nr:M56 family metallopeptidase [Longimicrobiales bacterium]